MVHEGTEDRDGFGDLNTFLHLSIGDGEWKMKGLGGVNVCYILLYQGMDELVAAFTVRKPDGLAALPVQLQF